MVRPTRRIDLQQVMRQARKMRQLCGDVNRESRSIGGIMDDVSREWSGNASREFVYQGGGLEGDMSSASTRMRSLADKIEREARNIKSEDDRKLQAYNDWVEREERKAEARARARAAANRRKMQALIE